MSPIVLEDGSGSSRAQILPELGFNCFSFQVEIDGRRIDVLNSESGFEHGDKKGTRSGIPWLFPFPNRIQGGRFEWQGQSYQLPATDGRGNAIHGFVMDRPWRITTQSAQTVTAEFQLSVDAPGRIGLWPADFLIEVNYRLERDRLRAAIRIVNTDNKPLPWGLGTHPYFNVPFELNSTSPHCQIQVPAKEAWELRDFIPTGRRILVESRNDLRQAINLNQNTLDDVLTGLDVTNGCTEVCIEDPASGIRVIQAADAVFRECVVFTPPGRACVCLEPYTCTTNAINLQQQGIDAGLRVLEPGAEFRTWFEIRVESATDANKTPANF